MARIRSVKPEFWDDEKLASVSRDARLLFIGIWNQSDDYGTVKGNSRWLLNKIFPYDNIKPSVFDKWLNELVTIDVIRPFESNGEKYFYIKNFQEHQKIDKPSKTRNPEAPQEVTLDEYSTTIRGGLAVGREGKGREVVGEGREESGLTPDSPPPKNLYGEFKNVKLTEEEFEKLKILYGSKIVSDYIEKLSGYLKAKGKKYQDHYATLLNWIRKDGIAPFNLCTGKSPMPPGEKDRSRWRHPDTKEVKHKDTGRTGRKCLYCNSIQEGT